MLWPTVREPPLVMPEHLLSSLAVGKRSWEKNVSFRNTVHSVLDLTSNLETWYWQHCCHWQQSYGGSFGLASVRGEVGRASQMGAEKCALSWKGWALQSLWAKFPHDISCVLQSVAVESLWFLGCFADYLCLSHGPAAEWQNHRTS